MTANPTADVPVPTLPIVPGAALMNALLKWSEQDRLALVFLLQDSLKERFTTLEEAEKNDRELIRSRIEDLVSGKVPLLDPEEMFAEMRKRIQEVRNQ